MACGLPVCGQLQAQAAYIPYHEGEGWDNLPAMEQFGPLTGGFPDPDGRHMWLLGRCGTNNCADSDRDPILKMDLDGNLIESFGGGLFAFTHGFYLDHEGYFWVSEGAPDGDARAEPGYRRGLGCLVSVSPDRSPGPRMMEPRYVLRVCITPTYPYPWGDFHHNTVCTGFVRVSGGGPTGDHRPIRRWPDVVGRGSAAIAGSGQGS